MVLDSRGQLVVKCQSAVVACCFANSKIPPCLFLSLVVIRPAGVRGMAGSTISESSSDAVAASCLERALDILSLSLSSLDV